VGVALYVSGAGCDLSALGKCHALRRLLLSGVSDPQSLGLLAAPGYAPAQHTWPTLALLEALLQARHGADAVQAAFSLCLFLPSMEQPADAVGAAAQHAAAWAQARGEWLELAQRDPRVNVEVGAAALEDVN